MIDNLRVFQYTFKSETLKILDKKKRESNAFFLFRNDMKRRVSKNIKMTDLSKKASFEWRKMSEYEKSKWKRLYEINRDLPQNTPNTRITTDKEDLKTTSTPKLASTDNDSSASKLTATNSTNRDPPIKEESL
jgi:hypothetical protein